MHLAKFSKVILTFVIFLHECICQQSTEFELENTPGLSEAAIGHRSGASGGKSVYLKNGGWIEFKICVSEPDPVGIKVENVMYSNDGPEDQVGIYIDNNLVGTFTSERVDGGSGHYWNVFKSSGGVGSVTTLNPGEHIVKVYVESADYYGIEVDKLVLRTDSNIYEYAFWCGQNPEVTQSQSSSTTVASTVQSSSTTSATKSSETPSSTSSSTSSTTTVSSSPPAAPEHGKTPFIEQLSSKSKCLDEPNIRIKFNPLSLVGVEIISKASAITGNRGSSGAANGRNDLKTCQSTVWQFGKSDGNSIGTGQPSQETVVVYEVPTDGQNKSAFPTSINPIQTEKLVLRFAIPAGMSLTQSVLYFTIGLVEIDKEHKIGVQYFDHTKNALSKIQYVTFKPKQRVIGWALPASAVSSSQENEVHVVFDKTSTTPIKFDFLRLDHTPQDAQQKNVFLVRGRGFSIKGAAYKPITNQFSPEGMSVAIDAGKPTEHFAKMTISNKRRLRRLGPVWNSFTAKDDGKLFPLHENRNSLKLQRDAEGKTFKDVSGVILGDPNNPISNIRITRKRSEIDITYADSTYVRLIYRAENGRTRLIIKESTLKDNSIEFISTHLTDYMAAVNQILIDNSVRRSVMDNLDNIKGKQFVFIKTSPNPMFHASTLFGLIFPENVIPK